jgi:hypothetical protein
MHIHPQYIHTYNTHIQSARKDKIVIEVYSASDLPAMDRFGSADPFVTVCVYEPKEGMAAASYESLEDGVVESFDTHVCRQTLNPEWNETLTLVKFRQDSEVSVLFL